MVVVAVQFDGFRFDEIIVAAVAVQILCGHMVAPDCSGQFCGVRNLNPVRVEDVRLVARAVGCVEHQLHTITSVTRPPPGRAYSLPS